MSRWLPDIALDDHQPCDEHEEIEKPRLVGREPVRDDSPEIGSDDAGEDHEAERHDDKLTVVLRIRRRVGEPSLEVLIWPSPTCSSADASRVFLLA
jgi:hypothetical protein